MRVHIIGTGLLGASLGLALSANGHQVTLEDTSPTAQQLAADLGAGQVLNSKTTVAEAADPTGATDAAAPAAHPDIVV
ncbi:MAG TPA: NAD(P)-binding domain-containing protein, partial [Brevibacterium epidermidis]|nr:NAD(P)-binding domain-containing protein [Brevibacterium epidermidis]